jgi:quinol monooxygenase YgiN
MGKFVQIVEYKTSRFDEVKAMGEEYGRSAGSLARRVTVTEDRDNPGTYVTVAVFDSYESAMENSNRPETSEFAARMAELCDGPPKFYNLDIVDEWSGQASQ